MAILPADLWHRMYSLSRSIDLRCVKQIDAIFIGQSHQLLRHLLRESGGGGERGDRMGWETAKDPSVIKQYKTGLLLICSSDFSGWWLFLTVWWNWASQVIQNRSDHTEGSVYFTLTDGRSNNPSALTSSVICPPNVTHVPTETGNEEGEAGAGWGVGVRKYTNTHAHSR